MRIPSLYLKLLLQLFHFHPYPSFQKDGNGQKECMSTLWAHSFHFHGIGQSLGSWSWIVGFSQFSSVQPCLTLWPHGLEHARLPCPSLTLRAYSNSCPSSQWCHATSHPSSCLQSFPASGSFPVSQFFASGGQSIGVSASALVLPKNIQDWFPLLLRHDWLDHWPLVI